MVHQCKVSPQEDFAAQKVALKATKFQHKYVEPVEVDITAEMGGKLAKACGWCNLDDGTHDRRVAACNHSRTSTAEGL